MPIYQRSFISLWIFCYCVFIDVSIGPRWLQRCSTAALLHCTGCSHPSVACGSCRKLLITVTRAAANSDHDTIFFCWCWCSSDASTDTIWFLLTSRCQGCQGIFRYTVVNSTQIVLLLILWRSQRWTFESRPRIHNPYSKFKILWRRLSNNMKLSNNINLCTYRYRATKHVSTLYAIELRKC